MISFYLNDRKIEYEGDENLSLLNYLREEAGITSVKDGCSGQAACGACTVEIDGKARLSCTRKMKFLEGSKVITMEGIPEKVRDVIAKAYVDKGAVQCGFCTPGLIMRTKVLFTENPSPSQGRNFKGHQAEYVPLHRLCEDCGCNRSSSQGSAGGKGSCGKHTGRRSGQAPE